MSLLKIANDVEELENQIALEESVEGGPRNRSLWTAGGSLLGGATGAAAGGALGAGLGAATGLVGMGIGQGKKVLGRGAPSVGRKQLLQLTKGLGTGGALAGVGTGAATGALAGHGASYIPDGVNYAVENRAEIADRAGALGRGAVDAGKATVDAGRSAIDYFRE